MNKLPQHIQENIKRNQNYYSLDVPENVYRCRVDSEYLGEVVIANEDLIWHSVHKYVGKPEILAKNHGIEKDDILQLGRLGFIKAVMAFDVDRGVKFSSFAVTAIVREIRCFLRDRSKIIRLTRSANSLMSKISRLEGRLGYLPSPEGIATILDEKEEKIKKVLTVGKGIKYLDEPVAKRKNPRLSDDYSTTLLDIIPDEVDYESQVLNKVMIDSLINIIRDKLDENELSVLNSLFDENVQTQAIDRNEEIKLIQKVADLIKDVEEQIKESE